MKFPGSPSLCICFCLIFSHPSRSRGSERQGQGGPSATDDYRAPSIPPASGIRISSCCLADPLSTRRAPQSIALLGQPTLDRMLLRALLFSLAALPLSQEETELGETGVIRLCVDMRQLCLGRGLPDCSYAKLACRKLTGHPFLIVYTQVDLRSSPCALSYVESSCIHSCAGSALPYTLFLAIVPCTISVIRTLLTRVLGKGKPWQAKARQVSLRPARQPHSSNCALRIFFSSAFHHRTLVDSLGDHLTCSPVPPPYFVCVADPGSLHLAPPTAARWLRNFARCLARAAPSRPPPPPPSMAVVSRKPKPTRTPARLPPRSARLPAGSLVDRTVVLRPALPHRLSHLPPLPRTPPPPSRRRSLLRTLLPLLLPALPPSLPTLSSRSRLFPRLPPRPRTSPLLRRLLPRRLPLLPLNRLLRRRLK